MDGKDESRCDDKSPDCVRRVRSEVLALVAPAKDVEAACKYFCYTAAHIGDTPRLRDASRFFRQPRACTAADHADEIGWTVRDACVTE